jgi:ABC-type multidrug transport system fused ATPase/permease subunit
MSTERHEWSDYARAVRQVAGARADAQQAQDRLTANRTKAEVTAMAEADAMAERGRKLEERLNRLAEKAAGSLEKAGVPADGKRVTITLPTVRGIADIEAAAAQLTKQLGEAVGRLEEVRAEARAERERRKRRTINAGLVLVAFAVVWSINGSKVAGVAAGMVAGLMTGMEAGAIVLLTLLIALRLARSPWIGWGAAAVVVVLMAVGLPWWLAILVPAIVAGTSIVLPKKRN